MPPAGCQYEHELLQEQDKLGSNVFLNDRFFDLASGCDTSTEHNLAFVNCREAGASPSPLYMIIYSSELWDIIFQMYIAYKVCNLKNPNIQCMEPPTHHLSHRGRRVTLGSKKS